MSYTIGHVIYGWDLGRDIDSPILKDYADLFEEAECSFGMDYISSGDYQMWLGLDIHEIDETKTVDIFEDLLKQGLDETVERHQEVNSSRGKFLGILYNINDLEYYNSEGIHNSHLLTPAKIKERLEKPPRLLIVWASS